MTSNKIRITITQKMIDDYRRANMSPNLFKVYIQNAYYALDCNAGAFVSVFVFEECINVTISAKTHRFENPSRLRHAIHSYYRERDTSPIDFTMDFSNDTIVLHQ